MSRRILAPLAVLLALALAPASAQAASLAYNDENGNPVAEGGAGDDTLIARPGGEGEVLLADPTGITVRDPDLGLCRQDTPTAVTCVGTGAVLLGGEGNDTLLDQGLIGGFGARGGPGDDVIEAGSVDAQIYGDDREVLPTDGNDRITGSSNTTTDPSQPQDFDDFLNGGGGNDIINAREGKDMASGQAGDDEIDGGAGDDGIDNTSLLTPGGEDAPGSAGNDTLRGGAGDDEIDAYLGRDAVDGGDGDDNMRGVELFLQEDDGAADKYVCGAGADRLAAGPKDRIAVGCETLRVALQCFFGYPCKVSGTITGKPKGAKKATTVAKATRTFTGPDYIDFALGKKATKLLGSAKKLSLQVRTATRKGGKPTPGARSFSFTLTPP